MSMKPKLVIRISEGKLFPVHIYNIISLGANDKITDLSGGVPFLDIHNAIERTAKIINEGNPWLKN